MPPITHIIIKRFSSLSQSMHSSSICPKLCLSPSHSKKEKKGRVVPSLHVSLKRLLWLSY
uniref:Uncharacterized protein n=1 Tax=Nelumbo nucifera TaxID=4432 RepID=A0A822XH60_NELNU|nr:TPA_asm: hypothetical protein HUJ06_022277 [Nelumbo nucifera]